MVVGNGYHEVVVDGVELGVEMLFVARFGFIAIIGSSC